MDLSRSVIDVELVSNLEKYSVTMAAIIAIALQKLVWLVNMYVLVHIKFIKLYLFILPI